MALGCFWLSGAGVALGTPGKAKASTPVSLKDRLQAFARRGPVRSGEWAVAVQRIGDRDPLMTVRPQVPLILASTTKVFTSAAALDRLGTGYNFRTSLLADDAVTPEGNLPGGRPVD